MAQTLEWEAELGERTRFQVLHEHVGFREHGFEQRLVIGPGEIEHHRLFAAIEPDEIGALAMHQSVIAAGEVALRPLHLDHARARIR